MNRTGLRVLIQPFFTRTWRSLQQTRNVRSHSILVSNRAPVIKLQSSPPATRTQIAATARYYGDQCAKNRFEPSLIEPSLMATYDDIVALPKHPEVLLIDVRQPKELAGTGTIPTSINIPLSAVGEALQLDPEEFQRMYGRAKPTADSAVIFCCRIGVRSGQAAYIAEQLGFTNVKNYVGSWSEYAERNNLPQ